MSSCLLHVVPIYARRAFHRADPIAHARGHAGALGTPIRSLAWIEVHQYTDIVWCGAHNMVASLPSKRPCGYMKQVDDGIRRLCPGSLIHLQPPAGGRDHGDRDVGERGAPMVSIRDAVGTEIDQAMRAAVAAHSDGGSSGQDGVGLAKGQKPVADKRRRGRDQDPRVRSVRKKLTELHRAAFGSVPTVSVKAATRRLDNIAAEARWLQRRDVVGVEPVLTDVDRMRLALSSSRVLRQNVRKAKATRSRVRTAASRATRELSDEQSRAVKP